MRLDIPPGVKGLQGPQQSILEATRIRAAVLENYSPVRSILQSESSIRDSIISSFPLLRYTSINFIPGLERKYHIQGLIAADCTFFKSNPNSKASGQIVLLDHIQICSTWRLDIVGNSTGSSFLLNLKTVGQFMSSIPDRQIFSVDESEDQTLGNLHPSLHVHQQIATLAKQLLLINSESVMLQLIRSTYKLADQQFSCKKLQNITMTIRLGNGKCKPCGTGNIYATTKSFSRLQYERIEHNVQNYTPSQRHHRAYIALGSNIGDRIDMIESACNEMSDQETKLMRTSALYETKAMYLEEQDHFINGVCEVSET